jgi:Tfp pilus assembly protein PilF
MEIYRVKRIAPLIVTVTTLVFYALGCGQKPATSPPFNSPTSQELKARWHNNQGIVYMDQHNYTKGRDAFLQAIRLDSTYANGYANLGISYYSLGQYDSARVSLETALSNNPDHLHAHYTLGLIHKAQGREHQKALDSFKTVLATDPDDPLVHYYIAQIQSKLDHSAEAIAAFKEAIRLDPYNVSSYYALSHQYRQQGNMDAFKEALETFNQLSQAGHQSISQSYQGQGKYAEVVTDAGFTDASVDDIHGPFIFSKTATPQLPLTGLSTFTDLDGDGDMDLVGGAANSQNSDPNGAHTLVLWRNNLGSFSAEELTISLPTDFKLSAVTAADINRDGHTDLVLAGKPTLLVLADSSDGWEAAIPLAWPSSRTVFADTDHDGDLDLLLLGDSNTLLANDGQGNYSDVSKAAGLTGSASGKEALFSDFDNDRDIDFLILGTEGLALFTNNRDGTFSNIAAAQGLTAYRPQGAVVEDFNQDGFMDLALVAKGKVDLLVNKRGKGFNPVGLPMGQLRGAVSARAADFDLDGDRDLLVGTGSGLFVLSWYQGTFKRSENTVDQGKSYRHLLIEDFNGDGSPDIWADGNVLLNGNPAGQWVKIALQGLNSNLDALGTKVEVKTTYRLQKQEVRSDARSLTFGLGKADSVEFIRILWPSGVRQTELAAAAGQTLSLTELNRKGTSCPILYAWDGTEFRFVTDILGGGIIGYLVGQNTYYTPDTDEYVRLGRIAPKDGQYTLQITNQLEEIIYLDALSLVAVDHPDSTQIYPNERLLSAPPYAEFRPYPLTDLRPLAGATDQHGRDISAILSAIDDDWFEGFDHGPIHGYAEDHAIILDLGDLRHNPHPVLLGYGWVNYAHSTSNWAAAQQNLSLYPPKVEVPNGQGGWTVVSTDMGCPAGLPKHMLFDLKDLFIVQDYRLRITTNMALYWDQFQIATAHDIPLAVHRRQASRGDLHWRGYPTHTSVKGTFAFRYHYDQVETEAPWGTHGGAFTRFGPVTKLLDTQDDRYVIMFHGDEVTAEFDAASFPPLASGLQRTFLLYADGFGKDMDFHSAHSLNVDPLPFHNMSSYPYPAAETYPQSEEHMRYRLEYNTRWIKGYYD